MARSGIKPNQNHLIPYAGSAALQTLRVFLRSVYDRPKPAVHALDQMTLSALQTRVSALGYLTA